MEHQVNSVGVRHVELFRDLLNYNITMSFISVTQAITRTRSNVGRCTVHSINC